MEYVSLCERIGGSLRQIIVWAENGNLLSTGTGVVIRDDGLLLTAAHVVMPSLGCVYQGTIEVLDKKNGGKVVYQTLLNQPLAIPIGNGEYTKPILIDLMLLIPKEKVSTPYLVLAEQRVLVGTMVIMAGFPDDIDLPFHPLENLNFDSPELAKKKAGIMGMKGLFRTPLFKHAMVGMATPIELNLNEVNIPPLITATDLKVSGAMYLLDNHLSYGGSGGAVVNEAGEVVAIITEKSLTDAKSAVIDKLPSGTGVAYSHQLIKWLVDVTPRS